MHKYIAILGIFLACPSCVTVINDRTSGDYKPAKVKLHDYAGVYKDRAVYSTPPTPILGLMGSKTFGGLLRGVQFGDDVKVQITKSREIIVSSLKPNSSYKPIRYKEGKDFEFIDHSIVFLPERQIGYSEVVVMGYASSKMKWMLDSNDRLVTIHTSRGGGLVTVIPTATWGNTVAVFERND